MGDHFMLLLNRLLTETTLEAAIEGQNRLQQPMPSASEDPMTDFSSHRMDVELGFQSKDLVACRICHDEDEDSNMEIPCSCSGTLKYAHRRCVQRWCNEKGDTVCEICRQQFKPGYTASSMFHYGGVPTNFRGNLEIPRRDLHNFQFTATVADPNFPDHEFDANFLDHEFDANFLDHEFDDYTVPTSRSLMCCRIVATIFAVLLFLRHALSIIIYGAGEYSMTLFMLLVLKTIGILLPIYIMVKVFNIIQRRRQDSFSIGTASSDEENELIESESQPRPHLIHVQ